MYQQQVKSTTTYHHHHKHKRQATVPTKITRNEQKRERHLNKGDNFRSPVNYDANVVDVLDVAVAVVVVMATDCYCFLVTVLEAFPKVLRLG